MPDRPEDLSFPTKTPVTAAGTYSVSGEGNEFVLSGTISGDVTISADQVCRVTVTGKLANGKTSYSMSGVLEVRIGDDVMIPSIRLVGVTKYGCLRCDAEILK